MAQTDHSRFPEDTQNRAEQPGSDDPQSNFAASSEDSKANRFDTGATLERLRSRFPIKRQRSWIIAGGVIGLLILGGVGWRVLRGSNAESQSGQGQPAGTPVKIAPVQSAQVANSSEYIADLVSPESIALRPQIQGRVSQIFAREGGRVRVGTPILQVDPEEQAAAVSGLSAAAQAARADRENAESTLGSLEAERISNLSNLKFAQRQYQRYASLANQGAVTRQQRDEYFNNLQAARSSLGSINNRIQAQRAAVAKAGKALQQAQANTRQQQVQLQYFKLTAPFDGIVGDIPVDVGDFVDTSTQLATVTQNQSLEVHVSVPTEQASRLRIGLPVELINPQGQTIGVSRISFIAPNVSDQTQSVLTKSIFNNSAGRIRTDQYTRARVIWDQRPSILVPTTAITRLGGEAFVFVAESAPPPAPPPGAEQQAPPAQPQLVARQKLVELGTIQGNNYQVLSGLRPGERLITSGILQLKDGAPITPGP